MYLKIMVDLSSPKDVLTFWFGNEVLNRKSGCMEDISYIDEKMGVWFAGKSSEFDAVQRGCTELVRKAGAGLLIDPVWKTPDGCLAMYDQVSSALVNYIVNSGWMDSFTSIERFFLGVAIQHSEDLVLQQIGVDIARNVAAGAPSEVVHYFANIKGYPMEHFEVIQKFGRFPSRNLALGRESTAEEIAWMASPECPSWAKSQLPPKSLAQNADNDL